MTRSDAALILVENFHIWGTVSIDNSGAINVKGNCLIKRSVNKALWQGCLPVGFGKVTGNFDCTIGRLASWDELPKRARKVRLTYDPNWPILRAVTRNWQPVFVSDTVDPENVGKAKEVTEIFQRIQALNVRPREKALLAQKELINREYFENAGME